MNQPVPKVTHADVERIVRRDFPSEQFEQVLAILDEYGKEKFHREKDRVQLAVLKLAKGNLAGLREGINAAKGDYRDVISWAEYPGYSKDYDSYKFPEEKKKEIYSRDWKQYEDWIQTK